MPLTGDAPELDADAYPDDLAEIRLRVQYDGSELFDEHNTQRRFDELLVRYERQTRNLIETHYSDETFAFEEDRVDELRARDVETLQLVYPVQEIKSVEWRRAPGADFEDVDARWYAATDHGIELRRARRGKHPQKRSGSPLTSDAARLSWRDFADRVRVTYDRGFDPVPADVLDIQFALSIGSSDCSGKSRRRPRRRPTRWPGRGRSSINYSRRT